MKKPCAGPHDPSYEGYGEERHLQRLDVLELVGVPLFDLLVLPRCEEQMSLGDKLEEHDAEESKQSERRERGSAKWSGDQTVNSKPESREVSEVVQTLGPRLTKSEMIHQSEVMEEQLV